jgi:8-amino-7-oxononanoate synthase
LRTGDLGFVAEGELFITGRIQDVLVVDGLKHYPQDIELAVEQSHPQLRPHCSAALAVPGGDREELVVLCEVERRASGDPEEFFSAIRRSVADEHGLSVHAIVLLKAGSIPKTSSGKIQRTACREAYLEGTLVEVARWTHRGEEAQAIVPAGSSRPLQGRRLRIDRPVPPARNGDHAARMKHTAEIVLEEVRKVAKDRAAGLDLDTVIAEIGLDSLERMEILASIEECFGGRFPEEIYPDLETSRHLIEAVERYLVGREVPAAPALLPDGEIPPEAYRVDQFPECVRLKENLQFIESSGLANPFFHVHQGVLSNRTIIGGREVINFASFNYLGMSGHPAVARAAKEAIDRYGTSVSASRLVSGEKDLHRQLETELAAFLGTEDAIVFPAGHSTNETVIGHLFGPGDLVLHDALAHNSIVQGGVLSGARRRAFAHNDHAAADELLARFRRDYRRVLLAIEGTYSMDGDFPLLPEFIAVKQRHKAILLVDEAHSLGTMGPRGKGIGEHFDVDRGDVELWMGTLSKSLGSGGGYIAGGKDLVQYLRYTAPGFVFATGISPPNTAAALAALRLLQAEPERVARLRERSELFLSLAGGRGLNTGTSRGTPVIPIILGNSIHCLMASQAMLERGINARPILHPAVEERAARIRFFITSEHTEEEIRLAVDVLTEELEKLNPAYLAGAVPQDTHPYAGG